MPTNNQNQNNQLEFIDILSVLSFVIGLLNYNETLTTKDKRELMDEVDKKTAEILAEIQTHLEVQDDKIDKILEMLVKE